MTYLGLQPITQVRLSKVSSFLLGLSLVIQFSVAQQKGCFSIPSLQGFSIMAPTPRSTSPVKGKARVYLCRPCGSRHVPPTGLRCPHASTATVTHRSARLLALKRPIGLPPAKAKATASRPRGRPRKSPVTTVSPGPGPSSSAPPTFDQSVAHCHTSLPANDSETESFEDFLPSTQPNRKRTASPLFDMLPPKRLPPVSCPTTTHSPFIDRIAHGSALGAHLTHQLVRHLNRSAQGPAVQPHLPLMVLIT